MRRYLNLEKYDHHLDTDDSRYFEVFNILFFLGVLNLIKENRLVCQRQE